jgi:hypothetical protein
LSSSSPSPSPSLLLSLPSSFYAQSVRWADPLSRGFGRVCCKYMQTLRKLMAKEIHVEQILICLA